MPEETQIKGLSNIAREIVSKGSDEFAIVLVDKHRTTGNVLGNLLNHAFNVSKNRITKLGPLSTNFQDALNLARKRDIVIAPWAIVANSAPVFYPPDDAKGVLVFTVQGEEAQITYHQNDGKPFKIVKT